jgi:hypothetical protein
VPAPELYGWRTDGEHVFIYTKLINGRILEQSWDAMRSEERNGICAELRQAFHNMRLLKQDPKEDFIGSFPDFSEVNTS